MGLRQLMDLIRLPVSKVEKPPKRHMDQTDADRRDRLPRLDGRQKLRHTSYKGLREVQDNAAVFKIALA